MDAHLADCSTCYETFAETVQFLLAEEPAEEPAPALSLASCLSIAAPHSRSPPAWPRPPASSWPSTSSGAHAPNREAPSSPSSPRRWARPASSSPASRAASSTAASWSCARATTTQGLDAQSPAVIAAVAHIRERAQSDTSPEALGALAVTYLVSGDVGGAVKALESATAQDPKNAQLSERPRGGLSRARQPPRRAVGHPEGARGRGEVDRAPGRAGRSLVQPRARARRASTSWTPREKRGTTT